MGRHIAPAAAAMSAVLSRPWLIVVHWGGNALLLVLFYLWLGLPERTATDLAASAISLVALLAGALWLYGLTLAAFQAPTRADAARRALERMPRLLPWTALIAAVSIGAAWRWPQHPLGLLAVPVVLALLPPAGQAAGGAFSLKQAIRILGRPSYWITATGALLLGIQLAKLLVTWAPQASGFAVQSASLALRFGLAGLLAVVAWLWLCAVIGELGRQAVSQPTEHSGEAVPAN